MKADLLEKVDKYPVPEYLLERVSKQHGYPLLYTKELGREAKRMLYLTVLSDDPVVPSHNVDMVWHEMIVFTRWYKDFCHFIGADFIHHDPEKPVDPPKLSLWKRFVVLCKEWCYGPEKLPDSKLYAKTKENYAIFYGEKPSPRFWG